MKKVIIAAISLCSLYASANHCKRNEIVERSYSLMAIKMIKQNCPNTFKNENLELVKVAFSSWDTEQSYTFVYEGDHGAEIEVGIEGECMGGYSGPSLEYFKVINGCY